MTIIERLATNSRRALVQCPSCLITKEMDYHKAKKRPLDTDVCSSCTLTERNKSDEMRNNQSARVDTYVSEHNKQTNNLFIIKFTKLREQCLVKCNICGKEYETQYAKYIFTAKGCGECARKLPKYFAERSENYNARLSNIYYGMLQRVYKPKRIEEIRAYQDKGITVCDEWLKDRETFYKWAQENGYDETLTLDRENPNGNYEPSNCRWATRTVQARNTKVLGVNNTSGHKGVSFTQSGRWRARIKVTEGEIYLGTFDTALEAALVYDSYILQNKLEHTLNFPLKENQDSEVNTFLINNR